MKALAALCVILCILYQVNGKSIPDHMYVYSKPQKFECTVRVVLLDAENVGKIVALCLFFVLN